MSEDPFIIFGEFDGSTGHAVREISNSLQVEDTNTDTTGLKGAKDNYIGQGWIYYYKGRVAEVIAYGTVLSPAEKLQVESYLAIKYGMTLAQTSATNYVASDDTVIWDATTNSTHNNDIAGIGQDDEAALNQTQTRSVNTDSIVTIGNVSAMGDLEFLVWGNNDGAATWTSPGAPAGYQILSRQWSVQENNGDVGTVEI